MSYTARAKPKGFVNCKEKLARAPQVLQALCQRFEWAYQKINDGMIRLNLTAKDKQSSYSGYVNFDTKTGEFTYDTDYSGTLLPHLRKIVNEDNSLSDVYEAADIGVANKLEHNWDWRWTGEDSIEIENTEVFA